MVLYKVEGYEYELTEEQAAEAVDLEAIYNKHFPPEEYDPDEDARIMRLQDEERARQHPEFYEAPLQDDDGEKDYVDHDGPDEADNLDFFR